jgi:hypothetical protein
VTPQPTGHFGCRIAVTDAIMDVIGPQCRLISEIATGVQDVVGDFDFPCVACSDLETARRAIEGDA